MRVAFCVDKIAVCNSCNNFGLFWATFCDHFLASFGEQFGYKIFLHLATLEQSRACVFCAADERS